MAMEVETLDHSLHVIRPQGCQPWEVTALKQMTGAVCVCVCVFHVMPVFHIPLSAAAHLSPWCPQARRTVSVEEVLHKTTISP
jgi:hypothetical protein